MSKSVYKKILVILILVILFLLFNNNISWALRDVTENPGWLAWMPTIEEDSTLTDKVGVILGVIRVIGIIVSVATLSFIGIKFMLGSVEEKANYKQAMYPWLIGATMVFAITTIPTIIYDVATNVMVTEQYNTNVSQKEAEKIELKGSWDAIIKMYEEIHEGGRIISSDKIETRLKYMLNDVAKTNTPYWNGYELAIREVLDAESNLKANIINTLNEYATSTKSEEITKETIIVEYEKCLKKIYQSYQNVSAKAPYLILGKLLGQQISVWEVNIYTWERIAKGFDDAATMVKEKTNQITSAESLLEFIANEVDNVENSVEAYLKAERIYKDYYWIGYKSLLNTLSNNCVTLTHITTSINDYNQSINQLEMLKRTWGVTEEKLDEFISNRKDKISVDKFGPLGYARYSIEKLILTQNETYSGYEIDWEFDTNSEGAYLDGYYDAIKAIANRTEVSKEKIGEISQKMESTSRYADGYKNILTKIRRLESPLEAAQLLYKYVPEGKGGETTKSNISNRYLYVLSQRTGSYYTESKDYGAYTLVQEMLEIQMRDWGIEIVY